MELPGAFFSPSSTNLPRENFLYCKKWSFLFSLPFSQEKSALIFQEMKTTKKFLTFSQKIVFLIFQEMETPKKIPYIPGNRIFLIFQEPELSELEKWKNLLWKNLYSQEMELSRPKLKKLLIFQDVTNEGQKTNKKICSEEIS